MGLPEDTTTAPDRLNRFAELEAPELEAAYRARQFPHDRYVGLIVIVSGALGGGGMAALDYVLFPGDPKVVGMWVTRAAFFVTSVLTFLLVRRTSEPGTFVGVLGAWYALTVGLHVYVGMQWPAGHAELRITAALTVLMTYCVMPLPMRWQTAGALLHTAGSVLIAVWLNPSSDPAVAMSDLCWLSMVNGLGLLLSYRLHSRHRLLFAALLRQSELSSSLGRALSEVRTLRGLIRVCAWCHKVHADDGWQQLEAYVRDHSHAEFTHGICPVCLDAATAEINCVAPVTR